MYFLPRLNINLKMLKKIIFLFFLLSDLGLHQGFL